MTVAASMNSSDSKESDKDFRGLRHSSAESPLQQSPSGPPMPLEPPKPFLLPPWTPKPKQHLFPQQTHHIQNENIDNVSALGKESDDKMMGMIDDESVPSIPDVPSPYSPPTASLFSGEDFPSKSHRKPRPFDDLSLLNNHRRIPQSQYIFNSSIPSDEEYQSHQPYGNHRQQLLPTILYLKKDLEESHASMHLLQQENKALAAECDRFQREMEHWNDQHIITVAEKDQQIADLKQQLRVAHHDSKDAMNARRSSYADCKQDLEILCKQLEASVASNAQFEECLAQLKHEAATKDTKIKNLRNAIKDQSHAASEKLKETSASYDAKLQLQQNECESLIMETDRLKAMNIEALNRGSKDLAKLEESFRSKLAALQAELKEALKELESLRAETASMKSALAGKSDEIAKLSQQLNDALAEDARKGTEIKGLRESLLGSTEREQQLQAENESIRKAKAQESKERSDEISQLQQALQQAEANEKALQTSAAQISEALKESFTKYGVLKSEKEIIENQMSSLKSHISSASSSSSSQERNQTLESEIERLKTSLSKAVTKCNDLRAERSALTKKLSQYSKNTENVHAGNDKKKTPEVFIFEDVVSDNDDMIPNRLERIRDAAERAALAKEQRRELHRIKIEHDKEVKRLASLHEQDMKDVFEEAKAEVTARSREIRRHLQGEYETKTANLERRYQTDLSRVSSSIALAFGDGIVCKIYLTYCFCRSNPIRHSRCNVNAIRARG
jgi:chromosome segregation ATPase